VAQNPGVADTEPKGVSASHPYGNAATHDLHELLGEASRHLRRVCIDHIAAVAEVDCSAGNRDQIGSSEQEIDFPIIEPLNVAPHGVDHCASRGGELPTHFFFGACVGGVYRPA
jgi:hypothetical protein